MKESVLEFLQEQFGVWYFPSIRLTDIVEILIIAFLIYQLILWIKNTKAWMLMKGILGLGVFILVAWIFRMNTILWIAENMIPVMATGVVIIFQPELRRALEKLGEKKFLAAMTGLDMRGKENVRFSQQTVDGIITAVYAMAEVKTGALIVIEHTIRLNEYESTGIRLDCLVSSQVLINIFEHNTPLHDGAIIVRGDRIVSATCYLPLTDNAGISKDLGTRHRAAIGMSEVSDALVVVVSEETGHVSVALGGRIVRHVTPQYLRERIEELQDKKTEAGGVAGLLKGWKKDERKAD